MSFHEDTSDLSRLHREAAHAAVPVDARTYDVIAMALSIAAQSDGCFDPTVAGRLVERGLLPRPRDSVAPAPGADWRDIELLDRMRVRFRRPLWLDLGGIAKGHAVDRALAVLRARGARAACVNAGGDLRRFGAMPERVSLRLSPRVVAPEVEVTDAAVATSAVDASLRERTHVDGRSGRCVRARAASVVAEDCMIADALTKVLLVDAKRGEQLLLRYRASACLYDARSGLRMLGAA
jgi:thiamine biosynthesis lipoprotein